MNAAKASRRIFFDLARRSRQSGRAKPGKVIVGVGAVLGDEGKSRTAYATITRLIQLGILPQEIVAARFSGGYSHFGAIFDRNNPRFGKDEHSVRMVPAGILVPGVVGYIAPGVLFYPNAARDDLEVERDAYGLGDIYSRFRVSSRAPLLVEPHIILGRMYDAAQAGEAGGYSTTGSGTWYGLQDAERSNVLKIGDLLVPDALRQRFSELLPTWMQQAEEIKGQNASAAKHYEPKWFDVDRLVRVYSALGREVFRDNIVSEDRPSFLPQALREGKIVYLEGSQGAMLHPTKGMSTTCCTSANVLVEAIPESTGIELRKHPHAVLGIFRICATTRHGPGPLPTETSDAFLNRKWGNASEYHDPWPLSVKVGFLDLNLLRASHRLNRYTGWAANILDGFDGMNEIPVCDYYVFRGDPAKLAGLPAGTWNRVGDEIRLHESFTDLDPAEIVPHIEYLPGWAGKKVAGIDRAEELPPEAAGLIHYVEEGLNMPESIVMLGTGEDNSHTIFLREFV